MPANHGPLGILRPDIVQGPPPPESGPRWRTNLARGGEARAYEALEGDHATKLLAFMVQQALDEHKANNRDFGVSNIRSEFSVVS
jgi:syntaxin-binding protein 1